MRGRFSAMRQALALSKMRGMSTDIKEDFVLKTFREQQTKVEGMMEALGKMQVPWGSSDESKVKKFVKDLDAARKKLQIPSMTAQMDSYIGATMDFCGGNIRSFLNESNRRREELGIVDELGAHQALMASLDKVEKAIGRPLVKSDAEGMKMFRAETQAFKKKNKLDSPDLEETAKLDSVKVMLDEIKAKMEEELDTIKRRDNLEHVDFDLEKLTKQPSK